MIPSNIPAGSEATVLASILRDSNVLAAVRPILREPDFFEDYNRAVYRAILALADRGEWLSADTVLAELLGSTAIEPELAQRLLSLLDDYVPIPSAENAKTHARHVRRGALRRRVAAISSQVVADQEDPSLRCALREALADLDALDLPAGSRFHLVTDEELESIPDPEPLIEGILPVGSLAMLYGEPEAGKSFLALDWALCVATGSHWLSHAVRPGLVVYIVSEGAGGMGKRVRAWKRHHHYTGAAGVHFLGDRVRLTDAGETAAFVETLRALPELPVLVVVDTLARAMAGANENDTKEAGVSIEHADQIRKAIGCAVLLIHHPNKQGDPRGNTSYLGGVDTAMSLKKAEKRITLACEKMKDSAHFSPVVLRLMPVAESCVVVDSARARAEWQESGGGLTENERAALDTLATHFLPNGGATLSEWMKASRIPDSTFYRLRTSLSNQLYVTKPDDKRGARYTLTALGRSVTLTSHQTTNNLSDSYHNSLSPGAPLERAPESESNPGTERAA